MREEQECSNQWIYWSHSIFWRMGKEVVYSIFSRLRTSSQANPPVNNSPKLWAKYKTQLTEDTEGWTKAGRNGVESISIKKKKRRERKRMTVGKIPVFVTF